MQIQIEFGKCCEKQNFYFDTWAQEEGSIFIPYAFVKCKCDYCGTVIPLRIALIRTST